MANVRKIRIKVLWTFADFCSTFLNILLAICKNSTRIDLVFDSHKEGSVRDTKNSRSTMKPIEISLIAKDTPLPVNMDTFWASVSNKAKLQMFLRQGMIKNAANMYPIGWNSVQLFQSSNMLLPCQSLTEGCLMSLSELDLTMEEADVWLVSHAIHATQTGAKRLAILSGITDVMVLALYFKAAQSVTFDLLISKIMFLFFKTTVKILNFR